MEFREAMETCHGWDAHFVTYDVPGWPENLPRLKKRSRFLEQLRAEGLEVVQWGLAYDYDLPDHGAWTVEAVDEFETRIARACDRNPVLGTFAAYYRTRRGARLVYVLHEPVPVADGEGAHRGLLKMWAQQSVLFDPACSDWTRFFRLPRVMRES